MVVGEHIGPPLLGRKVGEADDRNGVHPEQFRGEQPSVTGDHLEAVIHQDPVYKPELLDRARDLPDLLLRVGAGVVWVGPERFDADVLNPKIIPYSAHPLAL